MKIYEGHVCAPGAGKIAIVVSRFNRSITQSLLDGALEVLRKNSVTQDDIIVAWVPGAFELPTIAQRFAMDEEYQAVICLGCVIKGETSHDEHINRAVSLELARIGVDTGIPIIFGMLTCNTQEQALARSGLAESTKDKLLHPSIGNKGAEAAQVALEMLHLLEQLPPLPVEGFPSSSMMAQAARYQAGEFDGDIDDIDPLDSQFDDEEQYEEAQPWFIRGKEEKEAKARPNQSHRPVSSESNRSENNNRSKKRNGGNSGNKHRSDDRGFRSESKSNKKSPSGGKKFGSKSGGSGGKKRG